MSLTHAATPLSAASAASGGSPVADAGAVQKRRSREDASRGLPLVRAASSPRMRRPSDCSGSGDVGDATRVAAVWPRSRAFARLNNSVSRFARDLRCAAVRKHVGDRNVPGTRRRTQQTVRNGARAAAKSNTMVRSVRRWKTISARRQSAIRSVRFTDHDARQSSAEFRDLLRVLQGGATPPKPSPSGRRASTVARKGLLAAVAGAARRLAPETPPAVWDETVSFRAPALACASADCGNDAAALRGAYTKAGDAWFCADCWVEFSNAYPDEWTDSFGEETRAAESPPSSPDDAPAPAPRARTSIGRLFGGGALIEDDDDDDDVAAAAPPEPSPRRRSTSDAWDAFAPPAAANEEASAAYRRRRESLTPVPHQDRGGPEPPSDGESPLLVERRASLLPVRTRAASDGASPQEAALSPEFVQRRSSLLRVATRGASVTPSRRGAPDAAAVFAEPAEPPPEFVARRASLRPVNPP